MRFLPESGSVLVGVRDLESIVGKAIGSFMSERQDMKVMVILDGIDFMMAALGSGAGEILEAIGSIREVGSFLLLISLYT